ncbi:hypothetical protein BGW39_001716 [Mortierella sp. 14UC]|nr:hypothetical protein BGW39_001716 [Mortierella sp. 14UC]
MIDDLAMSTDLYIQILKEDLEASIKAWGICRDGRVFSHRSGPMRHKAMKTIDCLGSVHFSEDKGTLIAGPTHSLDLDPMEGAEEVPKQEPQTKQELWERISKEWSKIPVRFCQDLIKSMPDRIEAVRQVNGEQVKS